MKSVCIALGEDVRSIELHAFSDWHIGDKHCKMHAIQEHIKYIAETPNAYVICNGDLINNATTASVSDSYAEKMPPMEQLETLCGLLEPIKDRILLMTQGNHESRTYRADGVDLTAVVAQQLGIAERYVREGGVLFLRFGKLNSHNHCRKVRYAIYCSHGSGGGKKEGSKVNQLAEMAGIVDCDIYVHSHTHLPVIMKQNFFRLDSMNSVVTEVEKLFVNTASQLTYGGYGQTFGLKPSNGTTPVIYLDGRKRLFSAKL